MPSEAWIGWFGVEPESRGQGIGRSLLDYCEGKARDIGVEVLRVWTTTEPESLDGSVMYRRAQFVEEACGAYQFKPEFEVLVFSKSLTPRACAPWLTVPNRPKDIGGVVLV